MTYSKGAHFVLGTTDAVYGDDSCEFIKGFSRGVDEGCNIADCLNYAELYAGYDVPLSNGTTGFYPFVYTGNTTQYLNF